MKKNLILILILGTVNVVANAQTLNPYESFGYRVKSQYVMTNKFEGITLSNNDTSSNLKKVLLSLKTKQIFLFNESDSILQIVGIPAQDVLRFISVDPLTKKYPQLTPYQFASNTPIQAIDMDGLESFIVHGTTQGDQGAQFSPALVSELKRIGNNTQSDETFRWHAPLSNNESDRKNAAQQLVDHVWDVRADLIKNGKITDKEPITLVGYSHGGNVSIQAAKILQDKYDARVNLITLSTPAYNGKDDAENPANDFRINQHYHFVQQNDYVTTFWAGGDRTYNNNKTINFLITDKDIPNKGSVTDVTPHFIPYDPRFVQYLKNVPAMTTPPGNTGFLDDFIKASLNRH